MDNGVLKILTMLCAATSFLFGLYCNGNDMPWNAVGFMVLTMLFALFLRMQVAK